MADQGGGGTTLAQIYISFEHRLRVCLRYRLVKAYDQFRHLGCENCPFFQMELLWSQRLSPQIRLCLIQDLRGVDLDCIGVRTLQLNDQLDHNILCDILTCLCYFFLIFFLCCEF